MSTKLCRYCSAPILPDGDGSWVHHRGAYQCDLTAFPRDEDLSPEELKVQLEWRALSGSAKAAGQ